VGACARDEWRDVVPFSRERLFSLLSNAHAPPDRVATFKQARYLAGYLDSKGARTIVVEKEYIDGDYLEDFATYYVRCFEKYSSRCIRLHFFSSEFDVAAFDASLARRDEATDGGYQSSYLGFVVVRPLPRAIVGRTLLKTYDPEGYRRRFRAKRTYEVSLFGMNLQIESLPFQEQDSVIAACATVALWTAFHKTAELFSTTAPRPAVITNAANAIRPAKRIMPSKDLRIDQMCEAVRAVGLEPQIEPIGPMTPLASLLYGYLEMEVPVVLAGCQLGDRAAGHAITVVGYAMGNTASDVVERPVKGVTSIASKMDRLYVHDDNVGPFARLGFLDAAQHNADPNHAKVPFLLQGKDIDGKPEPWFTPLVALIPIYGKVRLGFTDIHVWAQNFMMLVKAMQIDITGSEWNIRLTDTQHLKRTIREKMKDVPGVIDLLAKPQPHYIWHAALSTNGNPLIDLLCDATGIARSCPVFDVVWHDQQFRELLKQQASRFPNPGAIAATEIGKLFTLLAK